MIYFRIMDHHGARKRNKRRVLVNALFAIVLASARSTDIQRLRLDWALHGERLLMESELQQYYRMSKSSFERLVCILTKERHSTEQAYLPSNRAAITTFEPLLVLVATFYAIKDEVVHPIISSKVSFAKVSSNNIITGCVGYVDGWVCVIGTPSPSEVADASACFSGHFQVEGINLQGNVNDVSAFSKWNLSKDIDSLPDGCYIIGDNAYALSDYLLVPFTKPELGSRARSDYNFYLSQLCLRIEMAFGLLVNMWHIFKRPLRVRLYNSFINERLRDISEDEQIETVTDEFNSLHECAFDQTARDALAAESMRKANAHILREIVVRHIQNYNLAIP
ncbi:hypothetical protein AeRB84_012266 [Aphanomyces euteiches]|nr:hypothetical protein AeRB84_012266 [Aphanomyces euteiches]